MITTSPYSNSLHEKRHNVLIWQTLNRRAAKAGHDIDAIVAQLGNIGPAVAAQTLRAAYGCIIDPRTLARLYPSLSGQT